ncbi:single-stranded-DNA-specific exonuclease RecJ [Halalkalibacter wakoensis JCM 9140]|uniref:Single-stranded-DNA-specific exonuclease RecJ n=1 Tax=Halalkalibacter wakoensis JCM 9140 TaxID=1236970 RepID=W4Q5Q4_9BACI|nr:single-stranded-DNA-specific exonuclease RecJ [Halalkalibacter wakoensis]GAE26699.1 single-stranded-DNA-specific exonuclease RecJ [Halalkalibacter wakoensis JCM 9140]
MLKPKARWKIKEQASSQVDQLVEQLNIAPLVATLLLNRGFETVESARQFLYKEEMKYHDPFLLDDMNIVVTRIREAIEKEERILIFGDYDADGVSSTTVMYKALQSLGADVDFYIPNRFTEGYGPNEPAIRRAKEEGYGLVVTVDTGIAAVHVAAVAKEINLDFIVTDHHEAPPVLPDAYAIVNPKKPGCPYPFKGLAGVGVALKVAQALLGRIPTEWLDIAVIGTIADLVPLIDENRLLVMEGLHVLQSTDKPGLIALKKKCGIDSQVIQADHVGFGIGPRINAAGRLDSADPAVHLLLAETAEEAEHLASEIDDLNKERQAVVSEITELAVRVVEEHYPPNNNDVLVIAGEGWNAGVIGIVASRLVERYYRPTIVLSIDREKGLAKGSARSIEGFDMFAELSKSRDILPHFGGHPMAAGLTMNVEDLDLLRKRLNEQAKEVLTEEDFTPITPIDLVATVDEISVSVIKQLEQLAPFGVQNPTPKVLLQDVHIDQMRKIGSDSNHLKVAFAQNGATLDGIGFHLGYISDDITSHAKVSAVGTLSINEWNGHVKAQLMIDDLGVSEWQLFDWRSIQKAKIAERLMMIPQESRLLVTFQKETKKKLGLDEHEAILFDEEGETVDLTNRFVVLLDIPKERDQLKRLFSKYGQPSRIYTIFYHEEDSFFTTNPNREQFKWYYAFLLKRKSFNIMKHSEQLAKHKGWSKETITFMTKVFYELGFVTIDDGIVNVATAPEKKGLEESATYRQKQELALIENDFVYSSYVDLKQWFDRALIQTTEETTIKETV